MESSGGPSGEPRELMGLLSMECSCMSLDIFTDPPVLPSALVGLPAPVGVSGDPSVLPSALVGLPAPVGVSGDPSVLPSALPAPVGVSGDLSVLPSALVGLPAPVGDPCRLPCAFGGLPSSLVASTGSCVLLMGVGVSTELCVLSCVFGGLPSPLGASDSCVQLLVRVGVSTELCVPSVLMESSSPAPLGASTELCCILLGFPSSAGSSMACEGHMN